MKLSLPLGLIGLLVASPLFAGTFTASGTNPSPGHGGINPGGAALAASLDVVISGDTATLTLTNTSADDVTIPSDVLTGVFFDITGNHALTPVSAVVPGTSSVFFGGTAWADAGGVVGGEWAYDADNGAGSNNGAEQGISSTGLGLFGGPTFPGSNLQGPVAVNGLQYGITSAGDDTTTGNSAVTGGFALIKNQVVFTFSGATGLAMSDFSNVGFQYGTSLSEPFIVPEASAMLVWALGGLAGGLGVVINRRRKRKVS